MTRAVDAHEQLRTPKRLDPDGPTLVSSCFALGRWSCAALIGFALSGCSDSTSEGTPDVRIASTDTTDQRNVFPKIADCPIASVRDTGSIMYVIADRSCASSGNIEVTLRTFRGGSLATMRADEVHATFPEFGSALSLEVPGIGQREITLLREGQWRRIASATWAPRDGAGLLVKDGKLFLLGGWLHGPVTNEVWSSDNLTDWQFLGFAPWPPRHGAGWVVYRDRLYVVSGELLADAWSSEDGVTWRQEAADAPFGPRYTPNLAALGDKLVLYGGQNWAPSIDECLVTFECQAVGYRDAWESSDGGRTWQIATPTAPWEGRGLIHGSIVFDDEIYLIGGGLKNVLPEGYVGTSAESSDIWTSRDGRNWELRSPQFSFAPRTHFSVLAAPNGCFVSDGSVTTQPNMTNDLFFAPDCINFAPVPDAPPLPARHASSVAYFNGTVVILGGPQGAALNIIWQYVPDACETC